VDSNRLSAALKNWRKVDTPGRGGGRHAREGSIPKAEFESSETSCTTSRSVCGKTDARTQSGLCLNELFRFRAKARALYRCGGQTAQQFQAEGQPRSAVLLIKLKRNTQLLTTVNVNVGHGWQVGAIRWQGARAK